MKPVVTNLHPISELKSANNRTLFVVGFPLTGKSTGIEVSKVLSSPVESIRTLRVQTLEQLDSLENFGGRHTYVELPTSFKDQEFTKWKEKMTLIQSRPNTIIEGREYVVRCLSNNLHVFQVQQENKFKHFINHIFSMVRGSADNYDIGFFKFAFDRNDAITYLYSRGVKDHENVLNYARLEQDRQVIYIPSLLDKGIALSKSDSEFTQVITDILESEKLFSLDSRRLHNIVLNELTDIPADSLMQQLHGLPVKETIENVGKYGDSIVASISMVASIASVVQPYLILIPIALSIIRFARGFKDTKTKSIKNQLVSFYKAYSTLPSERIEFIAYNYDRSMKLVPGTTLDALDALFKNKKEKEFHELVDKISSMLTEMYDTIDSLETKIDKKIKELRNDLLKEKGLATDIRQLGLRYNDGLLQFQSELGSTDSYVNLVIGDGYHDIGKWLEVQFSKNQLCFITGPKGIGKSILSRYLVHSKLLDGETILLINRISTDKLWDTLEEYKNSFVFYDPFGPEVYIRRKEIGGTEYSNLNLDNILQKIKSLINFGTKGLVVLPSDIWNIWKDSFSGNLTVYDASLKLKRESFLGQIIYAYCKDCTITEDNLSRLLKKILLYSDGYVLVAAYLGRWLNTNQCKVEDIEAALVSAQDEPIRFLQNYIWFALLSRNEEFARLFTLPLLVHVFVGNMTFKLAKELPSSITHRSLQFLNETAARWISLRHEDLMETALKKLTTGETNDKNAPELRELIHSIADVRNKFIATDESEVDVKILMHVQNWLAKKVNALSESQISMFLEYMAHYVLWVIYEKPVDVEILKYLQESPDVTPSTSRALILGLVYRSDDFAEFLDLDDTDYGTMLLKIFDTGVKGLNEIAGPNFTRALSYVIGYSRCKSINNDEIIIDSFLVLTIATIQYRQLANQIYWKTGRRLLEKIEATSKKSNLLLSIIGRYLYSLVMIADITPDEFALGVSTKLANNQNWIGKIYHIIISLRLANKHHDKLNFDNMIRRLESLSQDIDNYTAYLIVLLEVGNEIVNGYDSFNEIERAQKWYEECELAVTKLSLLGENDPQLKEWIEPLRLVGGKQDEFKKWLDMRGFECKRSGWRLAYRNDKLQDAVSILENLLSSLGVPLDKNASISMKLHVERMKFLYEDKQIRNSIDEIWNEAKQNRHFLTIESFLEILSNKCVVSERQESEELILKFRELLESRPNRSCIVYGHQLLETENLPVEAKNRFLHSMKNYAVDLAPAFIQPVLKYLNGNLSEALALDECSTMMNMMESEECTKFLHAAKDHQRLLEYMNRHYRSTIPKLRSYSEILPFSIFLLGRSSGLTALIIYATVNKDNELVEELLRLAKKNFKVALLDRIYDNLVDALTNFGLESDKFNFYIKKLIIASI